jgi:hypothetical protein
MVLVENLGANILGNYQYINRGKHRTQYLNHSA